MMEKRENIWELKNIKLWSLGTYSKGGLKKIHIEVEKEEVNLWDDKVLWDLYLPFSTLLNKEKT